MLKGIPKLLDGDILKALSDMGHGDLLAIVDANYPAVTMGRQVIEMPGISATEFLKAIMPFFPVDHIINDPALLMEVEKEDRDAGMVEPVIFKEFSDILNHYTGKNISIGKCSRDEFYKKSRKAFIIIHTGEERLYGNLLLYKGVI